MGESRKAQNSSNYILASEASRTNYKHTESRQFVFNSNSFYLVHFQKGSTKLEVFGLGPKIDYLCMQTGLKGLHQLQNSNEMLFEGDQHQFSKLLFKPRQYRKFTLLHI